MNKRKKTLLLILLVIICVGIDLYLIFVNPRTKIHKEISTESVSFIAQKGVDAHASIRSIDTQSHYGWGTFISNNGYLITAKHIIESLPKGFTINNQDYITESIIMHPSEDLAIIKFYDINTPCIAIGGTDILKNYHNSSISGNNISFESDEVIKPGMSGYPLYSIDNKLIGLITAKNNIDEKKGQGIYFSKSLLQRIQSQIPEEIKCLHTTK